MKLDSTLPMQKQQISNGKSTITSAITTYQPAQADILTIIDRNPKLQPSTKKQYKQAIRGYLDTGNRLSDADDLAQYAQSLSKSRRAFLKAAVRLWGDNVALKAKAGATPHNVGAVQATVYRLEALNETSKVEQSNGKKAHTWLTQSEVKKLLDACDTDTIQGKRDKIVLGLLTGAGLRREELAGLKFEVIILQPMAGKVRTVLNVTGKRAKDRIVPINDKLAAAVEEWHTIVGDGYVARSITKGGVIGDSISAIGVFNIVNKASRAIDKLELAPHDLRRTYAQLGYEARIPITQISLLLDHADVATTQRYLNLDLDLATTVSDFIPF